MEEVRIVGAGKGSTVLYCNTGDGCTATAVVRLLVSNMELSNVYVTTHAASTHGVQIGDSTHYVSGVTVRDNLIDGDSGDAAGSRANYGILLMGLENNIERNQIRFFSDGIHGKGTTSQGVNANVIRSNKLSSFDDGVLCETGNVSAGINDCGGSMLADNTVQTVYRYGALLQFGNSETQGYPPFWATHNYFEAMVSGIMVTGGTTAYDADVYSYGNSFASMADLAGTAGKPDADAIAAGIVTDSNYSGDVFSHGDRLNSVNCITHAGTGVVRLSGDSISASPCVPTLTGGNKWTDAVGQQTVPLPLSDAIVDGVQSTNSATGVSINSGPLVRDLQCADNAAGAIYWYVQMPDNWAVADATDELTFKMSSSWTQATPAGILALDIQFQCYGDSDAIGSSWSTAGAADTTYVTQNDLEITEVTGMDPGACAVGDTLVVRQFLHDQGRGPSKFFQR